MDSWLTHWKRPWCWEILKAGGEGEDRGWDGWMVSLTQWTWVCINSGSCWWTSRPECAAVHGVTKSWTRLSDWTELNHVEGIDSPRRTILVDRLGDIPVWSMSKREWDKGKWDSDFWVFYKRKVRNRQVAERESVFILNVDVRQIKGIFVDSRNVLVERRNNWWNVWIGISLSTWEAMRSSAQGKRLALARSSEDNRRRKRRIHQHTRR